MKKYCILSSRVFQSQLASRSLFFQVSVRNLGVKSFLLPSLSTFYLSSPSSFPFSTTMSPVLPTNEPKHMVEVEGQQNRHAQNNSLTKKVVIIGSGPASHTVKMICFPFPFCPYPLPIEVRNNFKENLNSLHSTPFFNLINSFL